MLPTKVTHLLYEFFSLDDDEASVSTSEPANGKCIYYCYIKKHCLNVVESCVFHVFLFIKALQCVIISLSCNPNLNYEV